MSNFHLVREKMIMCGTFAQMAFPYIQRVLQDERVGCAFTIRNGHIDDFSSRTILVGMPPQDKWRQYHQFSQEKAQRVMWNRQFSSWQSRDPENGKWGGAVSIVPWVLSMSGLKELDDEAYSLVVGVKSDLVAMTTAGATACISGNEDRVQRFLDAVKDLPFKG